MPRVRAMLVACAPFSREREPVHVEQPMGRCDRGELARHAPFPVDDGAEGVKQTRLRKNRHVGD
jgi:hypothetical protein